MTSIFVKITAVAALAMAPTFAAASTIVFGDGGNTPGLTNSSGQQTISVLDGARQMTVFAATWEREAGSTGNPFNVDLDNLGPADLTTDGLISTGLGVNSHFFDDRRVDGAFKDDVVVFLFDEMVRLTSIGFDGVADITGDEEFVFVIPGATPTNAETLNMSPIPLLFGDAGYSFGTGIDVMAFGIGAERLQDGFRIRELHAAPVPLPAAGWMLLAGVGGLIAMKRRQKVAA